MTASACIYIVDDDELVCAALANILHTVGYSTRVFTRPDIFLEMSEERSPACVLLDVMMPDIDGLQIQETLSRRQSMLPIIFVSAHRDVRVAVAAMKRGALDYVEKPVRTEALLDVVSRGLLAHSQLIAQRDRRAVIRERLSGLTQREREVLEHLTGGDANKEIALKLGVSRRTVEMHRGNIMKKLRAHSLAELVRMCVDASAACARAR